MNGPGEAGHAIRRALRRHRGVLAAVAAAVAVLAGLTSLAADPDPRAAVLAAARGLPGGVTLTDDDVATVRLPIDVVPDGALRPGAPVVGRVLAAAVRRGEPLTDVRLLGAGLLTELRRTAPDTVAAPVRIGDPGVASLVRPGDRVDVLATPPDGAGPARLAGAGLLVLAVPKAAARTGDGALVVLAASASDALTLARAAVGDQLSLTVRGP